MQYPEVVSRRGARRALALFSLSTSLAACAHAPLPPLRAEAAAPRAARADAPRRLRVVTYNVHFGQDVAGIARSLRDNAELRDADVLLLQEIRSYPAEGRSRACRLAEALGMGFIYAPARHTSDGGTHGLALLSRFPVRDYEVLDLPPFKVAGSVERRIALSVTLDVGGRPLRVYNVHLDTRLDPGDRRSQLEPVLAAAEREPAALVGGDFNTNPFRWLRRTLPVARAPQPQVLDSFMRGRGYLTPTAPHDTTMATSVMRLRLDAIYLRGLGAAGSGVERRVRASDHLPLWLDVDLPPA